MSAPPPPPPPAPGKPPIPSGAPNRGALLSSIEKGTRLRKVPDTQKNDRSAVQVDGKESSNSTASSNSNSRGPMMMPSGGTPMSIADAIKMRAAKNNASNNAPSMPRAPGPAQIVMPTPGRPNKAPCPNQNVGVPLNIPKPPSQNNKPSLSQPNPPPVSSMQPPNPPSIPKPTTDHLPAAPLPPSIPKPSYDTYNQPPPPLPSFPKPGVSNHNSNILPPPSVALNMTNNLPPPPSKDIKPIFRPSLPNIPKPSPPPAPPTRSTATVSSTSVGPPPPPPPQSYNTNNISLPKFAPPPPPPISSMPSINSTHSSGGPLQIRNPPINDRMNSLANSQGKGFGNFDSRFQFVEPSSFPSPKYRKGH